jgi:hypothetical protein
MKYMKAVQSVPFTCYKLLGLHQKDCMPLKGRERFQFKVWLGRTSTYTGYPVFVFKEFSFGATVVTIQRKM